MAREDRNVVVWGCGRDTTHFLGRWGVGRMGGDRCATAAASPDLTPPPRNPRLTARMLSLLARHPYSLYTIPEADS